MSLKTYLVAHITNFNPNLHTLLPPHSKYLEVEVALAPICLSIGHFGIQFSVCPNKTHKNTPNFSQVTTLDYSCTSTN